MFAKPPGFVLMRPQAFTQWTPILIIIISVVIIIIVIIRWLFLLCFLGSNRTLEAHSMPQRPRQRQRQRQR